jgi:hypothetical protein
LKSRDWFLSYRRPLTFVPMGLPARIMTEV